jgi:carboxymethylenebutenolidase
MSDLQTSFLQLPVKDGSTMQAYVAMPAQHTAALPAIIVFQEAFGVNAHIRDVTERFARQGFVAIAPELFHRTAPAGFEAAYNDFPSVAPHFQVLNYDAMAADATAAFDWLVAQSCVDAAKIACTGYCLGGRVSFIANTVLPLKAAISYYGGGIAPEIIKKADQIHAHHLFFWGGQDTHIAMEQINAIMDGLKAAGKAYTNVVFGEAGHAFFCDARPAYHKASATEAWALTLAFLENQLALS